MAVGAAAKTCAHCGGYVGLINDITDVEMQCWNCGRRPVATRPIPIKREPHPGGHHTTNFVRMAKRGAATVPQRGLPPPINQIAIILWHCDGRLRHWTVEKPQGLVFIVIYEDLRLFKGGSRGVRIVDISWDRGKVFWPFRDGAGDALRVALEEKLQTRIALLDLWIRTNNPGQGAGKAESGK